MVTLDLLILIELVLFDSDYGISYISYSPFVVVLHAELFDSLSIFLTTPVLLCIM